MVTHIFTLARLTHLTQLIAYYNYEENLYENKLSLKCLYKFSAPNIFMFMHSHKHTIDAGIRKPAVEAHHYVKLQ